MASASNVFTLLITADLHAQVQQIALVAMANELSKGLVGTVVQVTPTAIQFADSKDAITVSAGEAVLEGDMRLFMQNVWAFVRIFEVMRWLLGAVGRTAEGYAAFNAGSHAIAMPGMSAPSVATVAMRTDSQTAVHSSGERSNTSVVYQDTGLIRKVKPYFSKIVFAALERRNWT